MEKISIVLPGKKAYLPSLRLFAASLANSQGFNIEEVEDFRLVVSEAVNYKLSGGEIGIDFYLEEGEISVEVRGKDREINSKGLEMRDLILREFADDVEISSDRIKFRKKV